MITENWTVSPESAAVTVTVDEAWLNSLMTPGPSANTVYGPRQRPDMAFRKFLEAAADGTVKALLLVGADPLRQQMRERPAPTGEFEHRASLFDANCVHHVFGRRSDHRLDRCSPGVITRSGGIPLFTCGPLVDRRVKRGASHPGTVVHQMPTNQRATRYPAHCCALARLEGRS